MMVLVELYKVSQENMPVLRITLLLKPVSYGSMSHVDAQKNRFWFGRIMFSHGTEDRSLISPPLQTHTH